jgi:hypothetical protein
LSPLQAEFIQSTGKADLLEVECNDPPAEPGLYSGPRHCFPATVMIVGGT